MKKIFFAFAFLIALGSFAQNKTITLKVPQSTGMAGMPSITAGQSLVYNGTAWVGVTQYTATAGLNPANYATPATAYDVPVLTGIVNVFVFTSLANTYINLPAPSTSNGRTIVLKPVYTLGGGGSPSNFRLYGNVDGLSAFVNPKTTGTNPSPVTYYIPSNGGTEFNITLVCDGTSWWVVQTR